MPTGPTPIAKAIDDVGRWSCESPTIITAAVLITAVVILFVLFSAVPTANGGELIHLTVSDSSLALDGPMQATHRIEAEYVKSPSVRWEQGPVAIYGTDLVWFDTKGKKPHPAVSIPELIAQLQAKDREFAVRLEKLEKKIVMELFLPTFICAIVALVWAGRLSTKVFWLEQLKVGGKSCTPSKAKPSQS